MITSGLVSCSEIAAADVRCETCGDYESLGHVLQTCARTWNHRNKRHDYVVDKACERLTQCGFEVFKEPRIPTMAGIRIPDIIAVQSDHSAVVLDVTVVSDTAELVKVHDLKVKYYDVPEIRAYASDKASCSNAEVFFSAVALNWREAFAKVSALNLLKYGFTKSDLRLISAVVLEKSYETYLFSRRRT